MSTLVNENFDGLTPPALPSGWTAVGSWATTASQSLSSPNSIECSTLTTQSNLFSYNTIAPQADITVSAAVMMTAFASGGADQQAMGVVARSSSQASGDLTNGYQADIAVGPADSHAGLRLWAVGSTTYTFLAGVGVASFTTSVWYTITLTCTGTTITVQVQRSSDSNYLKSDGTWQSGATNAISVTDSTYGSAGYVGLRSYYTVNGTSTFADNFVATYGSAAFPGGDDDGLVYQAVEVW